MTTIEQLCRSHRTRTYFVDDEGLIGVLNHRYVVLWYRSIVLVGYSLVCETNTPQGAQEINL